MPLLSRSKGPEAFSVVNSLVLKFVSRKPLLKWSATWKMTGTFNHSGTDWFNLVALGVAPKRIHLVGGEDRLLCGPLWWRKLGRLGKYIYIRKIYIYIFFEAQGRGEVAEGLKTHWTCVTILLVTFQHTVFLILQPLPSSSSLVNVQCPVTLPSVTGLDRSNTAGGKDSVA